MGQFWGILGSSWALGAVLGPSVGLSGPSWAYPAASWAQLGASWSQLRGHVVPRWRSQWFLRGFCWFLGPGRKMAAHVPMWVRMWVRRRSDICTCGCACGCADQGGPKKGCAHVHAPKGPLPHHAADPGLSPSCPWSEPLWGQGKIEVFRKKVHGAEAKLIFSKSWPRAAPKQTKSVCNPVD